MITDQHDGRADKAQYIVRSHQGTTNGTERSSVLGGRQEEKAHFERKSKEGYSSLQASLPSPLRELTCHMGSHSVTSPATRQR